MEIVNFVCRWGGNINKIKSWSGVNNNVFIELKKKVKVNEIDLKIHFLTKVFRKLHFRSLSVKTQAFFDAFMIRKKAQGKILFIMCDPIYVGKKYDHYVYLDMTWSKLKDLLNDEAVKPYINYNIRQCKSLAKYQDKFLEKCKCVFCMSNYVAEDINKKNPKIKTKVVYAGANHVVKFKQKYGNHKILFVGNNFKRKNGYAVIEAFKLVKQQIKDAELYICTKGKLSVENYLFEGIHMLGDLDFDTLQNYFTECGLYCMPSLCEPFGIVFVEAIISGMPCIGLNKFEMPKIILNNGICVNDNYEIANAIIKIFNTKKYYENVMKNYKHYFEVYNWENVCSIFVDEIVKNGN